jgi:Na+/melibiose symporter-like transporter
MSPADRRQLSSILWALSTGGNPVLAVVLLVNMSGLFGAPGPGPIMVSLIWLLFFSALLFVRMLVNRPGQPAGYQGAAADVAQRVPIDVWYRLALKLGRFGPPSAAGPAAERPVR